MRKILMAFCVVALSLAVVLPAVAADKKMVVGSKAFTEQRLLGQIMIQLLEKNGFKAEDKTGLGGTLVVREALVNKQIDIAMEYTGTGLITILKAPQPITDPVKCYEEVKSPGRQKRHGLAAADPVQQHLLPHDAPRGRGEAQHQVASRIWPSTSTPTRATSPSA